MKNCVWIGLIIVGLVVLHADMSYGKCMYIKMGCWFAIISIFFLFSEMNSAEAICYQKHSDDICSFGESNQVIRYYYDEETNDCKNFLFDIECGSGGNNFLTKANCEKACKRSSFAVLR